MWLGLGLVGLVTSQVNTRAHYLYLYVPAWGPPSSGAGRRRV
jgi:hypothetical protein